MILHGRCFQDDSAFRGVGRYGRGLLRGLAQVAEGGVEVAVALDRGAGLRAGSLAEAGAEGRLFGAALHALPLDGLPAWRRGLTIDVGLRRLGADLLHLPAQFYAYRRLRLATPCVITVHDLIPLLTASSERAQRRAASRLRRLARFCRRARRVIVLSRCVREQCLDLLGVDPERVVVIPPGIEPHFGAEPRGDAEALRRHGLERPYFLYVGGADVHKNLGALLEAFRRFRGADPGDHELVLVGRHHSGAEPAEPAEPRVRRLGFVDDADLPALYRQARGFVSLSRHEGFALPVLEAMACGAAVVAARRAAIPETLGDAGLLVDPDDPGEAAGGLLRLVREPGLRLELRERGLARAAGFRWDSAAAATLEAYRSALRDGRRGAAALA